MCGVFGVGCSVFACGPSDLAATAPVAVMHTRCTSINALPVSKIIGIVVADPVLAKPFYQPAVGTPAQRCVPEGMIGRRMGVAGASGAVADRVDADEHAALDVRSVFVRCVIELKRLGSRFKLLSKTKLKLDVGRLDHSNREHRSRHPERTERKPARLREVIETALSDSKLEAVDRQRLVSAVQRVTWARLHSRSIGVQRHDVHTPRRRTDCVDARRRVLGELGQFSSHGIPSLSWRWRPR